MLSMTRDPEIYFGCGGGTPGFFTPVVSYAPRPMLKAERSRRIMLRSAEASMIRERRENRGKTSVSIAGRRMRWLRLTDKQRRNTVLIWINLQAIKGPIHPPK